MKTVNAREISNRTCQIIRHERRSRDLTQIQMAVELGISQSALSKIENSTMTPTLIPWLKFCTVFSLPPNLPLDEKLYKSWSKDIEKKQSKASKKTSRNHLNN
jgi:transcriptional regulator with XRE-family HTH domain